MNDVPVLEVGGTHVTAALVDTEAAAHPVRTSVRLRLDAHAPAPELLDRIAQAARRIRAERGTRWAVAIPGPFDYGAGVGRFRDVGKFEALNGIDVGAELARRLGLGPGDLIFLNDADAFALGEYHRGAANGRQRVLGVTLGTGVGTSFLEAGTPVFSGPEVPPDGRAHLLRINGLPLEEVVSRRAIMAGYAARRTDRGDAPEALDVREIADRARTGDRQAADTLTECFESLGRALRPWCARFRPQVVVVGGSMSASWDLVAPPLRRGLKAHAGQARPEMELCPAASPADAALTGAAHWALQPPGRSHGMLQAEQHARGTSLLLGRACSTD
ncbi:ROK family protein [Streptomyces sp. NPDC054765]